MTLGGACIRHVQGLMTRENTLSPVCSMPRDLFKWVQRMKSGLLANRPSSSTVRNSVCPQGRRTCPLLLKVIYVEAMASLERI